MDICIGGHWNGAKILKNELYHKKIFKIKMKGSDIISTYQKRRASIDNVIYTFWIDKDVSDAEALKHIQYYLDRKENK